MAHVAQQAHNVGLADAALAALKGLARVGWLRLIGLVSLLLQRLLCILIV